MRHGSADGVRRLGEAPRKTLHATTWPGARFRPVLLALVLVTMAAWPGAPTPLHAQVSAGGQGLQGGWAVNDQGRIGFEHSVSSQFDAMQQAGAGWVRINFRLGACFRDWTARTRCSGADGRTALEVYDRVVEGARARGLRVVGLLSNESWPGGQAQWTANSAEATRRGTGDNAYIQDFAQKAVRSVVGRYRGSVDHWEIWNEPNAYTGLDGTGTPTGGSFIHPSNFAWLLKRSYAEIKAIQPGTSSVVIAGSIFGHDPEGQVTTAVVGGRRVPVTRRGHLRGTRLERGRPDPAAPEVAAITAGNCPSTVPSGSDYLCSAYDLGIAKAGWTRPYPLDRVGQTLYVDQGGPTSGQKVSTFLQELRSAYAGREGATADQKRTVVSEIGWETKAGYVTPETQADNLRIAFQAFAATGYVERGFWFNVQDVPEANLYHGLTDGTGARKPAFGSYQTYAR